MLLDLLRRVTTESRITSEGIREAVIAISERVNRRVQILRLHWQAASMQHHVQYGYRALGTRLADHLVPPGAIAPPTVPPPDMLLREIRESAGHVSYLKRELAEIESTIRSLELEALREDFIKIQQDLIHRDASFSRVLVQPQAAAVGRLPADVPLPDNVAIAAVLRGPILLLPQDRLPFRSQDIVILIGPQRRLTEATRPFTHPGQDDSTRRV